MEWVVRFDAGRPVPDYTHGMVPRVIPMRREDQIWLRCLASTLDATPRAPAVTLTLSDELARSIAERLRSIAAAP